MATAARCWASGSRHIPFPSVFSPILTRRPKMRIPLGLCLRDRAGAPIRNRSSQSREDQIAVFPGFGSCHDTLPRCSPDSRGAAGHIEHGGHDGHSAVASFGVLRTGLYSVPQLRDAPSTSDQERVLGATGILVFFRKGHAAGPARTACCCYAADRILTAAMRYCAGPHRYRSQWWHRAITGLSTRACPRHVPETAAGGETSSSRPAPPRLFWGRRGRARLDLRADLGYEDDRRRSPSGGLHEQGPGQRKREAAEGLEARCEKTRAVQPT